MSARFAVFIGEKKKMPMSGHSQQRKKTVANNHDGTYSDNMIANNGWSYHTLPSCLAPGQYLLRAEIIALHSAYMQGQAQFYTSCAQLDVGNSTGGAQTFSSAVAFPGAYSATDAGIKINIYGSTGQPDNGGKAYTPPGPAVVTC